jgi:hypothetical protein
MGYTSDYLFNALNLTLFLNEPNQLGRSYYQVYAEYSSYDEDFKEFRSQDMLLASFTYDSEQNRWYPHPGNNLRGFETKDLMKEFANIKLYPTLAAMLESIGSDSELHATYLLTGRIK